MNRFISAYTAIVSGIIVVAFGLSMLIGTTVTSDTSNVISYAPASSAVAAENPCGPAFCVPDGIKITNGHKDRQTVYRVRFNQVQNGKIVDKWTAGPYFKDAQAFRVADKLVLDDDSRGIAKVRIEALSPQNRWLPVGD